MHPDVAGAERQRPESEGPEPVADHHHAVGVPLDQRGRLVEQEPVRRVDGDRTVRARAVLGVGEQPGEDGVGLGAHRAERAFFSAALRASSTRSSSART